MDTFPNGKRPPKHILTLKEAEGRLNPYKALLNQCIQHGWDAWRHDYTHKHRVLRARSRASIIFDEIVAKAQEVFDGIPDISFKLKGNSFLLFIGNDIIIRFKKIGKNGRCSNINTKQQVLFRLQQTVLLFPDMKEGTMLHAGYALDELQLDVSGKMIVCQFDNRVLWTIELVGEAQAPVIPMLVAPPQPPHTPRFAPAAEAQQQAEENKKPKRKGKGA